LQTIRLIIKGKVQGVYFRQSSREKAQQLGVTGTVKNLADETVEILASGTPEQLQQLKEWCRLGPPRALVNDVLEEILPPQEFHGFSIERR
jgi:acylphosphatase